MDLHRASSAMSSEKSLSWFHSQTNFDDRFKIVDKEMETPVSMYNKFHRQLAVTKTAGVLFAASISNGETACDKTESGMGNVLSEKATKRFARRHSSFEPRQALQSYISHCEQKKLVKSSSVVQRVQCIESLLTFHDLVSMVGANVMDESAGLLCSCPVLSYMNDEEEDSVDLVALRRIVRRRSSSSSSVVKEEGELWEFLRDLEDEPSADNRNQALASVDDESHHRVRKERRDPSYKILAKTLAMEGPQQVLHSLESSLSSIRAKNQTLDDARD
ncbi:hypothetical protein MHU86_8774 [Fragilaria crotonensis]|nr:hypothetical protein MHU86_8774 [Fragilaria crotonensis]